MPGERHETMIDDIREALVGRDSAMRAKYPDFGVTPSSTFFWRMVRSTGSPESQEQDDAEADLYVMPKDAGGPIFVEVGDMPLGKWDYLRLGSDKSPVRVLRVSFEGATALLNPPLPNVARAHGKSR